MRAILKNIREFSFFLFAKKKKTRKRKAHPLMRKNQIGNPQTLYAQELNTISNVKFTPREIDIIACVLHGDRQNWIAQLLGVGKRAVETQMRTIRGKIRCSTREGIISFIERSPKLALIKKYYVSLIIHAAFESSLKDISNLKKKEEHACLIVYGQNKAYKNLLLSSLENHLKQANLNVNIRETEDVTKVKTLISNDQILFLFLEKDGHKKVSKELSSFNFVNVSEQQNYYFLIFEVLIKLFPDSRIKSLFRNFEEQYECIENSLKKDFSLIHQKKGFEENKRKDFHKEILKNKKWAFIFLIFFVFLFYLSLQAFKGNKGMQIAKGTEELKESLIRSDLPIPTYSVLLQRPEELSEIDDNFKGRDNIQTIALVGPGGVGKTILARQYAHQQKADVIWEINAETGENINSSFENLAQALAKTEKNNKKLKELQEIKDLTKREERIILFVKEVLKSFSHWFLIYDNVEKFTDVQKYLPQDAGTWGRGKIILTTRDSNIQNNVQVNRTIQIKEINEDQKLNLFAKIMNNGNVSSFSELQKKEATQFLENIPPYPLDVSVAAYYLKTTKISPARYLENIAQNNKSFLNIQKNILKEAVDYTKTRYDILTLSIQSLINTDKDFGDLLLLIDLLDSQNIPRELLDIFKNHLVVDNFIYNLKKYSLITDESLHNPFGKTIYLHRSTQSLSLSYLTKMLTKAQLITLVQSIRDALEAYIKYIIEKEDIPKMRPMISHLNMFLSHTDILDTNIRGSIYSQLGCIYYHLRHYVKSKEILEKSFEILNTSPHLHNDEKLITLLKYLALINMELGEHEKAKEIVDHCLRDYTTYFSKKIPRVARTLEVMGDVYGVIGEYEKAKDMLEKSLSIYKKDPPKNHTEGQAHALALLGNTYGSLGEYEKSRDFLEKSLKTYEEFFPERCFDIAAILTLLGNTYIGLGEYEKAIKLLEQGIRIYKKNLPENHIDLAWASVYLAQAFEAIGEYEKANAILERSLKVHNEFLGESNIRSAWVLFHLGSVTIKRRFFQPAKNLLQKALIAYEKDYGKDHIETARIYRSLGQVELANGNLKKAEEYFYRALKIFQVKNHVDRYIILEDLAQIHHDKSKRAKDQENISDFESSKKQAKAFLHQAMEVIKAHSPDDSAHIKRIQKKLYNFEVKS